MSAAGTEQSVQLEELDGIARITITRAARRNSMTYAAWDELAAALDAVGRSTARVVVITGEGEHFCAGGDLTGTDRDDHPLRQLGNVAETCRRLVDLPQPTIARVDGVAAGAGFGLALACDFVVVTTRARMGTMFALRGLSPDFGISWLLPRLVGLRVSKRLCLLPELLNAHAVQSMGLVDAVVEPGAIDAYVDDLAGRLAAGPPHALRLTKRMLNTASETDLAAALGSEATAQTLNRLSEDAAEGSRAFQERRAPRFTGR